MTLDAVAELARGLHESEDRELASAERRLARGALEAPSRRAITLAPPRPEERDPATG